MPRARWKRRSILAWSTLAVLFTATFVAVASADAPAATDPMIALGEGNRLFRDGRLEEAAAAYEAGYRADAAHPTLVYNLGTTLHHLDRLPEAILWYRRAGDSDDAWMHDNLWLARRTLGSQRLPAGGVDGLLVRYGSHLAYAGIVLAWLTLGLIVLGERVPTWTWVLAALLAVACFGTSMGASRWASQPAVLMQDCRTEVGELPAGTEAWVRRQPDGQWRIAAESTPLCPPDSVALVYPDT